ncbi:MAG: hypothetical protein AB7G12_14730, partial [Thermoanaerobaculia bacterium]
PVSDRRYAAVESALGDCLISLGRFDEAETLLARSLRTLSAPETPETGATRERLERLRAARQESRRGASAG